MKKFDIPFYLQEEGSIDCGPVCTKMILEYFGIKKELKDLQQGLFYNETGTTIYDNAAVLIDEGLHTTAITAQPLLFSPDLAEQIKNREDLYKIIDKKITEKVNLKANLETLKKYLDKDGELKIEIPTFDHIKEAVDQQKPVLALLYGRALGSNEGGYHFVVISGYDETSIFINNPSPISKKQSWFPIERVIYAIHSSTTFEPDNGTILIVSK